VYQVVGNKGFARWQKNYSLLGVGNDYLLLSAFFAEKTKPELCSLALLSLESVTLAFISLLLEVVISYSICFVFSQT